MSAAFKWGVLGLLIFDGLLTLALEVLFLPTYIGSWPFPLSALVAGVVNVALVVGARAVTDNPIHASLPLAGWGFGFLVCLSAGPGGDHLLMPAWQTLLLLVLGIVPPMWVLFNGALKSVVAA